MNVQYSAQSASSFLRVQTTSIYPSTAFIATADILSTAYPTTDERLT